MYPAENMLYRYVCECGRFWWTHSKTILTCGTCGSTVRPCEGIPTAHVVVNEVTDNPPFTEEHSLHEAVWSPLPAKRPDPLPPIVWEPIVTLGKRSGALVGLIILSHLISNDWVDFAYTLVWIAWLFSLIRCFFHIQNNGQLLDSLLDSADNWLESRELRKRQIGPVKTEGMDSIDKLYLEGKIDAGRMDMLKGAAAGVLEDQEKLRLLKELDQG